MSRSLGTALSTSTTSSRGADFSGRTAQGGGQFRAGTGVIDDADGTRRHQRALRQPHPLLDEESRPCWFRGGFSFGGRSAVGWRTGRYELPQPGVIRPGVREIDQWQSGGAVGLGAQAIPRVLQIANGQLREIAGELAEIGGRSVRGADDLGVRASGLVGRFARASTILLDRQLQRRMFGQFDEGVDAERERGGDRLVESNGVAQVPEPVLVDRQVRVMGPPSVAPRQSISVSRNFGFCSSRCVAARTWAASSLIKPVCAGYWTRMTRANVPRSVKVSTMACTVVRSPEIPVKLGELITDSCAQPEQRASRSSQVSRLAAMTAIA